MPGNLFETQGGERKTQFLVIWGPEKHAPKGTFRGEKGPKQGIGKSILLRKQKLQTLSKTKTAKAEQTPTAERISVVKTAFSLTDTIAGTTQCICEKQIGIKNS